MTKFVNKDLQNASVKQRFGLVERGGLVIPTQLWCVANNNAEDTALQGGLDWACGQGGVDCSPIQQGGPCCDPSDVQQMACYAFNDYNLKHGMTDESCNFDHSAAVTSLTFLHHY